MRDFDWEGDNIGGAMSHLIVSFKLLRMQTFIEVIIRTARGGGRGESMGSEKVKQIGVRKALPVFILDSKSGMYSTYGAPY